VIEAELRRRAEIALTLLHLLIPDTAEADRVRRQLTEALSRPGTGARPLLDALSANPVLRGWMKEQSRERVRAPARYLTAELPPEIRRGAEFSVVARLTAGLGALSAALKPRAAGTLITISLWAPRFELLGSGRQELTLPTEGDSDPVEFGLRGHAPGAHRVQLRAFAGGSFLGELSTSISVQDAAAGVDPVRVRAALPSVHGAPGAVTLEVEDAGGGRYRVRLQAEEVDGPEPPVLVAGDARPVVSDLVDELRRLAAGRSGFETARGRRDRLRNLGVRLWSDAVPVAVRRQFWELRDGIRSVRIVSDAETLPWELVYPLDGDSDRGFLVDQLPVVRQVAGQAGMRRLWLRSAAYVLSRHRPADADAEIQRVKRLMGPGISDRGRITRHEELVAVLEAPPSLLHVAGHNDFGDRAGSVLRLEGGPFGPVDLAVAVQARSLAQAAPIVFVNACRSAGETAGLSGPMGWARQFMAAGAGAFLGTLWPVRSSAAMAFADAFYTSLLDEGRTLGAAAADARGRLADDDGDPTRLAYSVYGDPDATVRRTADDDD
jgi:hypothetical protein